MIHVLLFALLTPDSHSQTRETFQANTPSAAGAATYTAPSGWSREVKGNITVLQAPEGDGALALVEATETDVTKAVAAAWQAFRPEAKWPLKLVATNPPRDGWEERRFFTYETSPNERVVVYALAMRAGDAWTVALVNASDPTFEKRGSQFALVLGSLRPKGFTKESFAGRKALPLTAERIAEIKEFVESSMKKLGVPGAGLALVDGGKVVYEGGLGVKELGKPAPVDENTLFIAASNTKGMTTLLLAKLADEGKLRWDQPVTEIYPKFKLGDAETTKQVLVKHLVCACTGLPRQDLEWIFEFKNATPASSMQLLGTMQPTSKFGEVFQYSNLMAAAAGYVGASLYAPNRELGAAYDEAMEKKIFAPLGMKSTTFDMRKAQKGNHARPHGDDLQITPAVARMEFNYSIAPHRPAGGVWTSSHDLIRYVQMELGKGKMPDGTRIASEANVLARREPQIATGENRSYGMGLSIDRGSGVTVVHHGGSMAGYKSDIMLLPEYGIGAVLLTNSDKGGMLLGPFRRRILEIVFDGRPEAVGNIDSAVKNYKEGQAKARERLVAPADAKEAEKLAGRYVSKELGELRVLRRGASVVFDVGEWQTTVATRRNDDGTISFIAIDPTLLGFEFVMGVKEGKKALIVRDAQHEYFFLETV